MAKKKRQASQGHPSKADLKKKDTQITDLESRLSAAKELISTLKTQSESSTNSPDESHVQALLGKQKEKLQEAQEKITHLTQQLEDDKGIADNPNEEIISLKRQIVQYKATNQHLASLAANQGLASSKTPVPSVFQDRSMPKTQLSAELLTACIAHASIGTNQKRFKQQAVVLVDNAITLAEEIASRVSNRTHSYIKIPPSDK